MTSFPTHFLDKHKMSMLEETKTVRITASDVIRIIEKIASTDTRETRVKCEDFEIFVKK